jgi:hypothetical protein
MKVRATLAVLILFALCSSVNAAASWAQTPASLTGETFNTSTFTLNVQCNPDGTSSYTFHASGSGANGPYPGTFTVNVSGTFGAATIAVPNSFGLNAGPNLTLDETFTINSPSTNTTITGQKHLTTTVNPGLSWCGHFENVDAFGFTGATGSAASVNATTDYEATINSPEGTFIDRGTAPVSFLEAEFTYTGGDSNFFGFGQFFFSTELVPAGPATVTLSPADAVNNVGTSHTVTATVNNAGGNPVGGSTVLFKVQGADNVSGSCTTGSNGQCSFTYQGPNLPGADLITGCADANSNNTVDPGEPCGEATKAWILPTSTPGQVTGGGQILNPQGTDKIAFGFNAKSDSKGVNGECTLVDPSTQTNTKIKCLDVTTLVQSGTHTTFFGHATVDGVATTYRIDVDDLGEPGAGKDTFKIQTDSGYVAGGTLKNGNIQVHN